MRKLSIFSVFLALSLLVAGSLVHQTGSSLACPDWPLCNGTAFPAMRGGIAFEHGHRLIALSLVVVVIALAVLARKTAMRLATTFAIGLIVIQAGLGATTVILQLPPIVSIAHLLTAMTLLATLAWIAARTGPPIDLPSHRVSLALVLAQCVLGAVVRHSGAALACFGFPLCSGAVFPDPMLAKIHMLHRIFAVLVALHVIASGIRAHRVRFALLPPAIASFQIALGIALVLTGARFEIVTLHHATAALLVASLGFLVGLEKPRHGWVEKAGVVPWRGVDGV